MARIIAAPMGRLVRLARLREVVDYETGRWAECLEIPGIQGRSAVDRFAWLVVTHPEFRSLLHYRLRSLPYPLRVVALVVYPGERTLHIHSGHIGEGFVIQHGFASTITAASIGRDCWVNQQTTIGFSAKGQPTIGDGVRIGAAAVLIGPIVVGDRASIGANATVVRDVPAGATVVAPLAVELHR